MLAKFIALVPDEKVQDGWRKAAWRTLPGHVRGHEQFDNPPPPPGSPEPPNPGPRGVLPIDLSPSQAALEAAAQATKMASGATIWEPPKRDADSRSG
ncbi:MAG: hypothetical protein WBZ00_02575 [Solirubrobacterales bacterium]